MPNRKRICRLCLGMCINTFGVIKDHTKETLDILLLKIDLSVSEEPVMCTNCAENLEKFFDFKSVCFSTQGYVAPLINNKKSARLGQRDGKGDSENSICIPKDPNIYGSCMLCGLCMNPLTSRSLISQDSKEEALCWRKLC
ncbi:hypothetical protein NQ314_004926 [Rhamnusium bicolor]|uniref:ZAD domain-containing protein n=1 Tax=Rhamnusium bicolor TaxID=1586634 RepID=A0AAV8ZK41_9CUCU|nr:hypothetical protein NQ314_004926 [Rhamnusium bicolor]